jgi:hypothetical protein
MGLFYASVYQGSSLVFLMLVALSLLFTDPEGGWHPQRFDPPAEEARGGSHKKVLGEKLQRMTTPPLWLLRS